MFRIHVGAVLLVKIIVLHIKMNVFHVSDACSTLKSFSWSEYILAGKNQYFYCLDTSPQRKMNVFYIPDIFSQVQVAATPEVPLVTKIDFPISTRSVHD